MDGDITDTDAAVHERMVGRKDKTVAHSIGSKSKSSRLFMKFPLTWNIFIQHLVSQQERKTCASNIYFFVTYTIAWGDGHEFDFMRQRLCQSNRRVLQPCRNHQRERDNRKGLPLLSKRQPWIRAILLNGSHTEKPRKRNEFQLDGWNTDPDAIVS